MKIYFYLVFLLLVICLDCNAQNESLYRVSMKVNGSQIFKPIETLTVSANHSDLHYNVLDINKVIITDNRTLHTLLSFIAQDNLDRREIIKNNNDFGCFSMSVYSRRGKTKIYYLNSVYESQNYLKKLINVLISNKLDKNVISNYQFILSQLNYPAEMLPKK